MGYVRPSREGDAEVLAPRLREIDVRECWAVGGADPLTCLRNGYALSVEPMTIIGDDGSIIGMFGAAPTHPGEASVWLLVSDELSNRRYASQFLRQSRQWLDHMQAKFTTMFNFVDAENTQTLRWLRFAGFKTTATVPLGGRDHVIVVRKQQCAQ